MQFSMLASTYNSFGSHPTLRELAHRIARVFGEIEFGLAEVEIVVWKDTSEPTVPTLEGLRAKFRATIADLPKARFESKRQRLRINYASSLKLGWGQRIKPRATEAILNEAFHELVRVLDGFRSKLCTKAGLEFGAFVDALSARQPTIVHTGDSTAQELKSAAVAIDQVKDWSVRLKIDWSQYHPEARRLLDEPFYWDPANDASPHGVNTGAYLLSDFRRWRQRHPRVSPWEYFLECFRKPGLLGRLNEFRQTKTTDYVQRDGPIAKMHDRDVIALAFALLKIDGACDPKVGGEALMALARKQDAEVASRLGWTITARDQELATQLEAMLRRYV